MKEMQSCAKCGGRPVVVTSYDDETGDKMYSIECPECGRRTARRFEEGRAVVDWNRVQNRNAVYDDVIAELRY